MEFKNKKIDITKIAKETNLSRQTIYNLLKGKIALPKYDTMLKIANNLNCTTEELKNQIEKGGE